MKFNITNSDINRGNRRDTSGCAIARSVRRTLKVQGIKINKIEVEVTQGMLSIYKKGGQYPEVKVSLPKHASSFVARFDNNEEVKPFVLQTRNIVKELTTVL